MLVWDIRAVAAQQMEPSIAAQGKVARARPADCLGSGVWMGQVEW